MSQEQCRIACVQLYPQPGQVRKNVERVKELTKGLVAGTLDMLVLPEMALTGYIFSSNTEIEPLLEDPQDSQGESSPSYQLAKQLAIRLCCYVVIGFPLKFPSSRVDSISMCDARPVNVHHTKDVIGCYNAALLVDARGQLIHVFRKHFNYEDDKRWASEGPGFQSITLAGLGKVCIAICMDLNPYDFKAPFDSFELANYCKRENVDMLIMPMAWLMINDKQESGQTVDNLSEGPNATTINYWATRLTPFLEASIESHDFYFVCCNRTGTECKSKFAGSSCALHFNQKYSKKNGARPAVALLGAMSRREAVQTFHLDKRKGAG